MDLKAHEEALQNIRTKYAQMTAASISNAQKDPTISTNDLFHTPIKVARRQEVIGKAKAEQKTQPPILEAVPIDSAKQQPIKDNIQIMMRMKMAFSKQKGRDFDDIVAERDRQLTQRVERNKQLLSKSKEVRERQSKNASLDKPSKENKDGRAQLDQLRLILKDKNYAIADKTKHKNYGIGHLPKEQATYSSIKNSCTDKIRKQLAENFDSLKEGRVQAFPKKGDGSMELKQRPTKQTSLIKTPIPPPKESSPSKIQSIFSNTQKIEERIQALLSR